MRKHFFQRLWERLFQRRPSTQKLFNSYSLDIELTEALRGMAETENRYPEELAADLLSSGLAHQRGWYDLRQRWNSLSPREQDVAALICLNCTTRQVAARLYLSESTIRTHSRNVLVKFAINNRKDLRRLLAHWDFSAWE